MLINGNILVYANKQLITTGKNLITNSGKSIFLDWLSHGSYYKANLYMIDKLHSVYNGVSLSSLRFATGIMFMCLTINVSELSNLQQMNGSIQVSNDTIYMQLQNTTNISGICINATINSNNLKYKYAREVKIYYSTELVVIANNNNKWNLVKIALNNFLDTTGNSSFKVIRFDSIDTADGYINARSFKLLFDGYSGNSYKLILNGIGLLLKTPYPNVPCVIGLGSGIIAPKLTDTNLTSSICKLFVNKQLCEYETNTIINGVQTTELKKLNLNHRASEIADLGINKINIVYISRIDYNLYNNRLFTEIGLFYPNNQIDYLRGADNCNMMFSHGLFNLRWTKNSSQLIDIKYIISISV